MENKKGLFYLLLLMLVALLARSAYLVHNSLKETAQWPQQQIAELNRVTKNISDLRVSDKGDIVLFQNGDFLSVVANVRKEEKVYIRYNCNGSGQWQLYSEIGGKIDSVFHFGNDQDAPKLQAYAVAANTMLRCEKAK